MEARERTESRPLHPPEMKNLPLTTERVKTADTAVVVADVDSAAVSEVADSAVDSVEGSEVDSEEEEEDSVGDEEASEEVEAVEKDAEKAVEEDIVEDAEAEEDSRPVAKAAPKHLKSPVNKKNMQKSFKKSKFHLLLGFYTSALCHYVFYDLVCYPSF